MDRPKARLIRERLNEVFALVAADLKEELGVTVTLRNGTIGRGNVMFQLEIAEVSGEGVAQTREVEAFKREGFRFGFKPEHFGREFNIMGTTFNICGLKSRARTYPILGKNKRSGKVYKFSAMKVLLALKAS